MKLNLRLSLLHDAHLVTAAPLADLLQLRGDGAYMIAERVESKPTSAL